MVQKNEMSARALTMEEMENVNGGMLKKIGGNSPISSHLYYHRQRHTK